MKIRKIENKDFEEVNRLYKKLYTANEPDMDFTSRPIDAEMISLLVEEDKKIIGFVSGTVVSYVSKTEGQIWDLLVDKEYRGKGLGKKLVSDFEEAVKIKGATYMMVWTDPGPEEEDPTPFYEKFGYHKLKSSVLTKKLS